METFVKGIVAAITTVSPSVQATKDDPCSTAAHILGNCKFKTKK